LTAALTEAERKDAEREARRRQAEFDERRRALAQHVSAWSKCAADMATAAGKLQTAYDLAMAAAERASNVIPWTHPERQLITELLSDDALRDMAAVEMARLARGSATPFWLAWGSRILEVEADEGDSRAGVVPTMADRIAKRAEAVKNRFAGVGASSPVNAPAGIRQSANPAGVPPSLVATASGVETEGTNSGNGQGQAGPAAEVTQDATGANRALAEGEGNSGAAQPYVTGQNDPIYVSRSQEPRTEAFPRGSTLGAPDPLSGAAVSLSAAAAVRAEFRQQEGQADAQAANKSGIRPNSAARRAELSALAETASV
jgi:hypothetical protein